MKTTFLKTAALLLMMLTAEKKSFAVNSEKRQEITELTWISNFSKIEVHGNVQLHLLSGEKNKVEMSSTYYDHNALVQVENGVLRITCYRTQRLNVWVTVNNLRALSAYDNVLVQTEGRFSVLDLDVDLFNKAKADLYLNCLCTNIKLNDRSMADISGTAMESDMTVNYASTLNSTDFLADQTLRERIVPMQSLRVQYAAYGTTDDLFSPFDNIKDQSFSIIFNGNQLTVVNTY